jgi:LCP family protein required for cell wall assembly
MLRFFGNLDEAPRVGRSGRHSQVRPVHSPPVRRFTFLSSLVFAVVALAACSSADDSIDTTIASTTSTTPTTTRAAPTTSTELTTTTAAILTTAVTGDADPELGDALGQLYSYWLDDRNTLPNAPDGLLAFLASLPAPNGDLTYTASIRTLGDDGDTIAAIHVGESVWFAVRAEGSWRIVGGQPAGQSPWLGDSPRLVLVLGSDARVGQNQLRFRADSIHIIGLVPSELTGGILGIPRDTYVTTSEGDFKFTNLMAGRGPEIMLETATELSGLPLEGYIVTGFKGYTALLTQLGGLFIDLPTTMRSGNNWANFPAGEQQLNPTRALQLARIRKGLPGGDFARSLNQGRIMQAAMDMIQPMGIESLPMMVELLLQNAWTDLSTEDLVTLAAAAYLTPSDALVNRVVPGTVGRAGTASVVFLDPEAKAMFADLGDGTLDE